LSRGLAGGLVRAFARQRRAFGSSRRSSRRSWRDGRAGRRRPGSSPGRRTLQAAPDFERVVSDVSVTDPRHPLFGQPLRLLSLTCSRGPSFVAVALPDGRRRLIRRAATDLERPLVAEAALPRISVRALLPLARHIRSMLATSQEEACRADIALSSPPPPTAEPPSGVASTAMAGAADHDAGPAGSAGRPAAPARPGRRGASC
jgi:hypothetical protein